MSPVSGCPIFGARPYARLRWASSAEADDRVPAVQPPNQLPTQPTNPTSTHPSRNQPNHSQTSRTKAQTSADHSRSAHTEGQRPANIPACAEGLGHAAAPDQGLKARHKGEPQTVSTLKATQLPQSKGEQNCRKDMFNLLALKGIPMQPSPQKPKNRANALSYPKANSFGMKILTYNPFVMNILQARIR